MVFSRFSVQIFCLFLLFYVGQAEVFQQRDEANSLIKRPKRANSWFEELKPGSLERECNEERCSFEEAREIFQDHSRTMDFWTPYNDENQCLSNPCQNEGICKDEFQSYTCTCLEGYEGRNCESALNSTLRCRNENGGCEHFCRETESLVRECECAKGYRLGQDKQSCIPEVPYPCGKIPVVEKKMKQMKTQSSTQMQLDMDGRIVGGSECPKGECPWQAVLTYNSLPFCGGVLLTPTWVVTAAHCLLKKDKRHLQVVLGEHRLETEEGSEQRRNVVEMTTHKNYVIATSNNDIALLKLQKPLNLSDYVVPICLPEVQFAIKVLSMTKFSTVSGWGRLSEHGPTAAVLQRVELPRIKTQDCIQVSKMNVTENMFCAGFKEGKQDSCKGDSGGPHVTKYKDTWFLTGVVSFGDGCARENRYGIYARVSRYIDWLEEQMNKL